MSGNYLNRGDLMNQNPEQKARDNIDKQFIDCVGSFKIKTRLICMPVLV